MDGTCPPTKVELSLIPMEELIQEIFRRNHAAVIGVCVHSALALASNLTYRINKEEMDSMRPSAE